MHQNRKISLRTNLKKIINYTINKSMICINIMLHIKFSYNFLFFNDTTYKSKYNLICLCFFFSFSFESFSVSLFLKYIPTQTFISDNRLFIIFLFYLYKIYYFEYWYFSSFPVSMANTVFFCFVSVFSYEGHYRKFAEYISFYM